MKYMEIHSCLVPIFLKSASFLNTIEASRDYFVANSLVQSCHELLHSQPHAVVLVLKSDAGKTASRTHFDDAVATM